MNHSSFWNNKNGLPVHASIAERRLRAANFAKMRNGARAALAGGGNADLGADVAQVVVAPATDARSE